MPGTTPILLVDNSNTYTKFALAGEDGSPFPEVRRHRTRSLSGESIRALLQGWRYGMVCISSVVEESRAALESAFAGHPVRRVCAAACGGLFAGYGGSATLGADRVANVLAALRYGRLPAVAVDMGTAATFDVVGQGPRFLGGIIAPGAQLMADALHGGTSLLPRIRLDEPAAGPIGENTAAAMRAGASLAFAAMVHTALHALETELGARPFAIATGGSAREVARLVPEIDTVDELLTLKGVGLFAVGAP